MILPPEYNLPFRMLSDFLNPSFIFPLVRCFGFKTNDFFFNASSIETIGLDIFKSIFTFNAAFFANYWSLL